MNAHHFPIVMTRTLRRLAAAGAAALALSGCSLWPEAKPDPTRFYVLSSSSATATPAPANAPVVHVRPVELASYLRSQPFVVRKGDNEIEFREFARWGESLDQGIARVLREELLARGAAASVSVTGSRAGGRPADYELSLRVLALEGAADGAVIFRAVWELSATRGESARVGQGDYRPADLRWDAKTESSLAAQLSQAVVGLSAEIAAAIPKGG